MATPLTLLDALLRGTLLALLLLMAAVLRRDRPRAPAALAGVALALGQVVQTVGAAPWIEQNLPFVWQMPLIAVSVANVVLFCSSCVRCSTMPSCRGPFMLWPGAASRCSAWPTARWR